jgi:hypothetical protein
VREIISQLTHHNTTAKNVSEKESDTMRIIGMKVYQYDELSDDAKEKARDWYRDVALDYEWWESIFDSAADIGLKIEEFDLNPIYAKGKLTENAEDVAKAIMKKYSETCDIYQLAEGYLDYITSHMEPEEPETVEDTPENNKAWEDYYRASREYEDDTEETEKQFRRDLLAAYATMLDNEAEYLTSDEAVEESIIANEYEFTEDGKIF